MKPGFRPDVPSHVTAGAPPVPPGNNFGAIRLIAASLVVFGHAYVLTGQPAPRWLGTEVHVFAVRIFFVVSGYLVCDSWNRDPHLLRFLWRRALRIMPALLVTVLLTVLVLGPLATRLPLGQYAAGSDTRLYLWNALLAPYFSLPGVFDDGRPFTAVNGSLWSLPAEVAMYLALPCYGLARVAMLRRAVLPVVLAAALGAAFWFGVARTDQVQPVVWWTSVPFVLRFAGDFVAGAAVRAWRLERRLDLRAALAAVALTGLAGPHPWAMAALSAWVAPYAVLALALAPRPAFMRGWTGPDISYGVYLWAAPLQQVALSWPGLREAPLALVAVSLPAAWAAGWASWRLVERRALRFRPGAGDGSRNVHS